MISVRCPVLQNPPRLMNMRCVITEWEMGDLILYSLQTTSCAGFALTPNRAGFLPLHLLNPSHFQAARVGCHSPR